VIFILFCTCLALSVWFLVILKDFQIMRIVLVVQQINFGFEIPRIVAGLAPMVGLAPP